MVSFFESFPDLALNGIGGTLRLPLVADAVTHQGDNQTPSIWEKDGAAIHYFASSDVVGGVEGAAVEVAFRSQREIELVIRGGPNDDLWRLGHGKSFLMMLIEEVVKGREPASQISAKDHRSTVFGSGQQTSGNRCFARSIIGPLPTWALDKPTKQETADADLKAAKWLRRTLASSDRIDLLNVLDKLALFALDASEGSDVGGSTNPHISEVMDLFPIFSEKRYRGQKRPASVFELARKFWMVDRKGEPGSPLTNAEIENPVTFLKFIMKDPPRSLLSTWDARFTSIRFESVCNTRCLSGPNGSALLERLLSSPPGHLSKRR
jgi:hypothetical protein